MRYIYLKLNVDLGGHPKGRIIRVRCNDGVTPNVKFWRDRIKDSKTDNCLKIVKLTKKKRDSVLNG